MVRIFNTYGPNMSIDDGRVISNFISQAIRGLDITIFGDGTQTRSFCCVKDLVSGLVKMMASPKSFLGPVNIGNPVEYTILEIAHKIIKFTDSKSKLVYLPLPKDDPKQRKPDIKKAKKHLAWQPNIKLNEGLKKTIDYFEKICL